MQGYGRWRRWWHLELPLVRPAIAVGLSLVAMETLADFGTVSYFAVPTLTTAVNDVWLGYGDLGAAAQIALELAGVCRADLADGAGEPRSAAALSTTEPVAAWGRASAACGCARGRPGLSLDADPAGIFTPLYGAAALCLASLGRCLAPGLWDASLNSLQVAGWAALVASLLALLILFAQRLNPRFSGQGNGLAWVTPCLARSWP